MEVTDDKSLPKPERKARQVAHAPNKSQRAKMIKLADKTSNLRAIASSPPVNWTQDRCIQYIEWAHQVAAGCAAPTSIWKPSSTLPLKQRALQFRRADKTC